MAQAYHLWWRPQLPGVGFDPFCEKPTHIAGVLAGVPAGALCVSRPLFGAVSAVAGFIELSWWDVVDLHPSLDRESVMRVIGIVVEEPAVGCAEHILVHLKGLSIVSEFGCVSFAVGLHGGVRFLVIRGVSFVWVHSAGFTLPSIYTGVNP